MKKTLLSVLAFLPLALFAQQLEVVSTGGQYLARNGISITATIGEVFVSAPAGKHLLSTEGFQQGFLSPEASVSRTETVLAETGATLFPNPASNQLRVNLQGSGLVLLQLRNQLGILLAEHSTESGTQVFDVSRLPAGQYWILVRTESGKTPLQLPFTKVNP